MYACQTCSYTFLIAVVALRWKINQTCLFVDLKSGHTCTSLFSFAKQPTPVLFNCVFFSPVSHVPLSHPNEPQMGTAELTEGGEEFMCVGTLRSKNHLLSTVSSEDEN